MTLKEKFNDSIITNIDIRDSENRMYYEYNHLKVAEECERIADDYAIEFAKWYHSVNNNEYHLYPNANIEKHLEIFKKEKGL